MKKRFVLIIVIGLGILITVGLALGLKYTINFHSDQKNYRMDERIDENITVVDVTNLDENVTSEHEHTYKTMYDENKHWNECTICNRIENEMIHNFKTTWQEGSESCKMNNYYTKACSCGYSYIGTKPCVWNGTYTSNVGAKVHYLNCSVCKGIILGTHDKSYYYKGILYKLDDIRCKLQNGNIINCNNLGRCSVCNYNHTKTIHRIRVELSTGKIYCELCGIEYGSCSYELSADSNTPANNTLITKIKLKNGATFNRINGGISPSNTFNSVTNTVTSINSAKDEIIITNTMRFNSNINTYIAYSVDMYYNIGSSEHYGYIALDKPYLDLIKPTISDIRTENESTLTEWSRTKPIIITGTENWTNTVRVKIVELENEENIIFQGEAVVNNGSYSISCVPEVEAGINGRKFKAIVTDTCDNSIEQEFEIAKVDAIAPKITSSDRVGGDWAKSKNFTFTANDYGIGNVSIAFANIDDLKLANSKEENEYSRDYKFVGDVYREKEISVLYKDGLGNTAIKKVIIDKLDNTAPTITNVEVHNNKLSVDAHDEHQTLGEGSGVVKYRYMTSTEKLENVDVSNIVNETNVNENIVVPNIFEVKYVYVVAEDVVRKCK